MHVVPRRRNAAIGLVAAASLALSGLAALPATAATDATVTVNDPGKLSAGQVHLTGRVAKGSTVLYVLDATSSTASPANRDCDSNPGVTASDDVNGDGSIGDVLDCEITGVRKLNSTLLAPAGGKDILAGIEAFGSLSAVADLSASGTTFASPADTGGEPLPRVVNAAVSIKRGSIGRYNPKPLGTTGITYDKVLDTALAALAGAPDGPKWVFLLSDGKVPLGATEPERAAALQELAASGIHLKSFAVGDGATCNEGSALVKMAQATHEQCTVAPTPSDLADALTSTQPDGISSVAVTVAGVSVNADIDAIGGWTAPFSLGKGTYTATATATLTSGRVISSAPRQFSVSDSASGPPPGSVNPGSGAKLATVIHAHRPKPSRTLVPGDVHGTVGLYLHKKLAVSKRLAGATVLLQGRKNVGALWVTLDRDKVNKSGIYTLHWKPRFGINLLRVALQPKGALAGASAPVRHARIYGCSVKKVKPGFSMVCHTTAKNGSKAQFFKGKKLVDKAKVRAGLVKVHSSGKVKSHSLIVKMNHKKRAPKGHLAF